MKKDITKATALKFVILLSLVSLFADMTYEGARSISGPFLAVLGANAAIVGFVSGFGEFLGYALRLVSGFLADRTEKYWLITIIGYLINLLAVPLLALAGNWWMAATLMILERTGKAIRVPPRDAMLSHAGGKLGMGWIFGLHEAIDQTGALLGPLIVAAVLYYKHSYQYSFAILLIPALLALAVLAVSRFLYPHPKDLEIKQPNLDTKNLNATFWLYLIGASLMGAGYADFPLMAYHFQKTELISVAWVPLAYAMAMGVSALIAPILGAIYDRKGFSILIFISLISAAFAPLVFMGGSSAAFIGIALWSAGISAHETLMRAIVANMISSHKRASAYGIFNTGFGFAWFLGSFLMGVLYDISIMDLVIFSVGIQLIAIPVLWTVMRRIK